jgi:hypothetical protein
MRRLAQAMVQIWGVDFGACNEIESAKYPAEFLFTHMIHFIDHILEPVSFKIEVHPVTSKDHSSMVSEAATMRSNLISHDIKMLQFISKLFLEENHNILWLC